MNYRTLVLVAAICLTPSLSLNAHNRDLKEIYVHEHDCTSINRAIHDPKLTKGGFVRLEGGTYECIEPVVMDRDDISLVGAGSGKTLIRARVGYPMPVVTIGVVDNNTLYKQTKHWGTQVYPAREVHRINLEGIAIDGNMTEATKPLECYDAREPNPRLRGRDCEGDGGRFVRNNGLTIRRAVDVYVKDVRAVRAHSGGLTVEKECRRLFVDGFYSAENRFDGFAGYETEDSVFRNMLLEHQPYSGISIDLGFEHNRFENVIARDNDDRGIYSVQNSFNTFKNVRVLRNASHGIYIVGRQIQAPTEHIRKNAKFAEGSCQGLSLEGVQLMYNGSDGIYLGPHCTDLKMVDTVIRTPGSDVRCIHQHHSASVSGRWDCNTQVASSED